jgi:NTE family protein
MIEFSEVDRERARARLNELGPRPWLVLGGGGLKGLGHLGVWRVLEALDFRPAGIVGTSIGALVGASIAGRRSGPEMEDRALALEKRDILRLRRGVILVNGIKAVSVFRGTPFRDYLEGVLDGLDWDDLQIPLQVNATSLRHGTDVWFGPGARLDLPLLDAVEASAAVPVVYPPVPDGDDFLVDGGVTDSFPLSRAVELGCTGIVGVDVGAAQEDDPAEVVETGMIAIHHRVFSIQAGNRRRKEVATWSGPPLLFVRPHLEGYSTFDFDSLGYFLDEGDRAVRRALGLETDG